MSVDMAQFHQVFFEESFEGLEAMESGLMELELGTPNVEDINTIFRAAHSIKGGAGTFGFMHVSNFTHVMETILDEMRDGKREVTREAVDLLLEATDILSGMLTACQDGDEHDEDTAKEVHGRMEAMLKGEAATDGDAAPAAAPAAPSARVIGWHIGFTPEAYLLRTGNDPLRMFNELAELGQLSATINLDKLPALDALDPEEVHLSWQLKLDGECSEDQVNEVFSWVDDDCELSLEAINEATAAPAAEAAPAVAAAPAAEERREGDRRKTERRSEAKTKSGGKGGGSTSIRVDIDKVDALINLVGELVITQSMLSQQGDTEEFDMARLEKLKDGLGQLERNTRELQEAVMSIRMMPISFSFSRFPRLVRDLSSKMGKQVELKLSGENTELDKTVMEKIGDPMVHLVRNSLDHGLETPDIREAKGKDPTGTLQLNAFHEGGNIVIQITDDGNGLNTEKIRSKAIEKGVIKEDEEISEADIHRLIFAPGFSTADQISDVSGRGVGMDVVLRNIKDLGGRVDVVSEEGKGSTFSIRLPLTLAILDGQLVKVGEETFIVPLISIIESLQIDPTQIRRVAGATELYKLRDDYIPIMHLADVFNVPGAVREYSEGLLVVIETDGEKVGVFVDDLLGQQQVVIKSLESNYKKIDGVSGATILGDGDVALILDIHGMVAMSQDGGGYPPSTDVSETGVAA